MCRALWQKSPRNLSSTCEGSVARDPYTFLLLARGRGGCEVSDRKDRSPRNSHACQKYSQRVSNVFATYLTYSQDCKTDRTELVQVSYHTQSRMRAHKRIGNVFAMYSNTHLKKASQNRRMRENLRVFFRMHSNNS